METMNFEIARFDDDCMVIITESSNPDLVGWGEWANEGPRGLELETKNPNLKVNGLNGSPANNPFFRDHVLYNHVTELMHGFLNIQNTAPNKKQIMGY